MFNCCMVRVMKIKTTMFWTCVHLCIIMKIYSYTLSNKIIRLVGHLGNHPLFPLVLCVSTCALGNAHAYTVFSAIFPFAWRMCCSPTKWICDVTSSSMLISSKKPYNSSVVYIILAKRAHFYCYSPAWSTLSTRSNIMSNLKVGQSVSSVWFSFDYTLFYHNF